MTNPICDSLVSFQRYNYYITKGITSSMLAPPPDNMMDNVRGHIPPHLLEEHNLLKLRQATEDEIVGDYDFSSRKAISESNVLYCL